MRTAGDKLAFSWNENGFSFFMSWPNQEIKTFYVNLPSLATIHSPGERIFLTYVFITNITLFYL